MQSLNPLNAISPIDGRYRDQVENLSKYFSEFALINYRIFVEIEYFIALCRLPLPQLAGVNKKALLSLPDIYKFFSQADALRVKAIEKETNHDVKAVEYFIKNHFDKLGLEPYKEFIHFGLTSQDINNTAIPLSIKAGVSSELLPLLQTFKEQLVLSGKQWAAIPMLARTHGQPASPTRLGKEINVFVSRLNAQLDQIALVPYMAKFGGATGNFNAHVAAFPGYDWHAFADSFVSDCLGLKRSFPTTQIEHYDALASLFDGFKRINTILIDLSRDIWMYISMNYFVQKINKNEVGSSTMPHKVNPIDFENAEGNLGLANALLEHLSAKLPISRLQRDLTDSTVLRNIGVLFAHMIIAIHSLIKGWNKLTVNQKVIEKALEDNWVVVAEGIQTILRRESYPSPFETVKALMRTDTKITKQTIKAFIDGLAVKEEIKEEMRQITPFNYTGS